MVGMGAVSSSRFVGRRDELAQLSRLLDHTRAGQPGAVVIAGDAGIGKTRLVAELTHEAVRLGGQAVSGGCVDLGDATLPYSPFIEILRALVRSEGVGTVLELAGPTRVELGRLLPDLAVGEEPGPVTQASPGRLYLALLALLEGLSRKRPLVLVVEDLHWADRTSRELLSLLVRNLHGRVLTILTVRTDERPITDPLQRFLAELERAGALRLRLGPLDRADQARQLASILGVPPSSALVDHVHGRAEGNPFFAEELLALGVPSAELPVGVRDLLLARLEALGTTTRAVLRTAAVAGRGMSHELLSVVAELPGAELDAALREALDGNVLVPRGRSGVAFRHALLQEAIATTVAPTEAARIHRRLAEALASEPTVSAAEGHGVAARIAHHWLGAGDDERALAASLVAATAAETALAFPTALEHYEHAIAILDRRPGTAHVLDRPRYQVLWRAAESAHLAAFPERAAELVRAAIVAVADDPGHSDIELHHAYLHERLGRYLWMSADGHGAMAAYEQAVSLVPTEPGTCWQAAIYSGYAQMLMLSSRYRESVPWCEEAIRLTVGLRNARSTEGHARNNLGVCLASLGQLEEGVAQLRLARRIAEEEADDVDDVARAIVNLHTVLLGAGRLEEAADVALDGIAVIRSLGLERRKGIWCRCDAADALLRLGRWEEADAITQEALDLAPAGIDAVRVHDLRGHLHLARGELTDAARHLDEARARAMDVTDGHLNGPLWAASVELATWQGQPEHALVLADEGLARLRDDEDPPSCLPLHAAAVAAAADLVEAARGRRDAAAAATGVTAAGRWLALAEAAVARDVAGRPEPLAHLLAARAEHDRAVGRRDPATWAAAADAWERMPQPGRAVAARLRQAEAALHAGQRPGDVAATVADARSRAEVLGAAHLARALASLAARAGLDRAVDDRHGLAGFHLTRREGDVLALVAEGRTDRQIGEALFISHRTVERHVSNILTKLGAATRTEATAIAHRAGAARV